MDRDSIYRHIDAHLGEHIEHIQRWVRQPSVSWDNLGVEECAELVAQSFRDLGCVEVATIEGRVHPGVWAYYDAGSPVTIHSYCMFDTRPVHRSDWNYDPWGAELAPMGSFPKVLIGRGAMGAKGPYVAFLNALQSIIATEGTLPVNIMFLAEGEEIMGSPSYQEFVERYADRLRHAQVSYCAQSAQGAGGAVSVGLGLKGMIVLQLTASGGAWPPGPKNTIHSSAASLVGSPPFRLAVALASLTRPDGLGCAVSGLEEIWSYRKPLNDEERQLVETLAQGFHGRDWRDVLPVGGVTNVPELEGGASGIDPLISFLYGPTFNVAGIYGGFLGASTSTVPFIVPSRASALLDMRLVVNVSPNIIVDRIRNHLDEHGFSDIAVEVFSAYSHSQTPASHPIVQSTLQTLHQWNVPYEIWPIQGGGGPWTAVPNTLGVPCIRGAVIGGGSASAADEYLVIEGDGNVAGLADVEKFHVDLLFNVAHAIASHNGGKEGEG